MSNSPQPMKVLLTGTYSTHNKGDFAMQITAANQLQELGHSVTVTGPFPDLDKENYERNGVNFVKSNRRRLIQATWQLGRLLVWKLTGKRLNFLIQDKNLEPFKEAGLIIDLSGDMLTEDYGPHVAYSHYIPLLTAILLDKPFVVMAQSVGPFKLTRLLAQFILRNATLVTVRDPLSFDYLEKLNIARVQLTADIAFGLTPTETARSNQIWDSLKLDENKFIVGVSVSELVASHHSKRTSGMTDFWTEVAQALDAFATRHSVEIVFFSHVTGPSESKDDRVASRKVASIMRTSSHVIEEHLYPAEIKYLISKSDMMMGCRMHANIAALSTNTPVLAISYSHKTDGIMKSLGLSDQVIDAKDATSDQLLTGLLQTYQNAASITQKLEAVIGDTKKVSLSNITKALEAAKGAA